MLTKLAVMLTVLNCATVFMATNSVAGDDDDRTKDDDIIITDPTPIEPPIRALHGGSIILIGDCSGSGDDDEDCPADPPGQVSGGF